MLIPDLTEAVWRKSTRSSGANNCVEIASGDVWQKSSRSSGNTNCVEVSAWRKSSRSNGAQACVEVAGGSVWAAVRDSKDPSGPALTMTAASFRSFISAVQSGALIPA